MPQIKQIQGQQFLAWKYKTKQNKKPTKTKQFPEYIKHSYYD